MADDDATRRSEIALTFARLCPELRARSAEVEERAGAAPYEVMAEVARQAVANAAAVWVSAAFTEAERLVGNAANPIGREVALLGFFENLQNIASHRDTRADARQL